MYGATAIAEPHQVDTALPEWERCTLLDEFLMAVSEGWSQVMSFLDSCELDRETRETLRELQRADAER